MLSSLVESIINDPEQIAITIFITMLPPSIEDQQSLMKSSPTAVNQTHILRSNSLTGYC
jgi:hypothetical protein